jgi:hypothetical protein
MTRTPSKLRVIPDGILFPAHASPIVHASLLVLAPRGVRWSASSEASWISLAAPTHGAGTGMLSYSVEDNPSPPRKGTIRVAGMGMTHLVDVRVGQAGGSLVQSQTDQLLASPMIMELGVAGKLIAEQIAKAPPPAQPPLLAAAEALVEALAALAITVRLSFATVPQPRPLFGRPPGPLPVTTQFILRQAALLQEYIPAQVAESE